MGVGCALASVCCHGQWLWASVSLLLEYKGWRILANQHLWADHPNKGPGSIVAVVPTPCVCGCALVRHLLPRRALGGVMCAVLVAHTEDLGGVSAGRSRLHHQRSEELALEASELPATGGHQQNLTKRRRQPGKLKCSLFTAELVNEQGLHSIPPFPGRSWLGLRAAPDKAGNDPSPRACGQEPRQEGGAW